MSQRAKNLSDRIKSFSDNVIAFVETLSDEDWAKTCKWEEWSVGATAYHVGAGHLATSDLAGIIVRGEALPPLNMDQINEMSNKQAREHEGCTKADALEQLKHNSAKMVAFAAGLTDEELDRKATMPAFDGEVTTEQFIGFIIFESAVQHFDSMKAAVGK
ncbi:hypothetical protein D3OALGA1CA_438 [Olavius algarvensis associated proteobacterium Delta 3]|nr:hypothetical protein D3OALGB2SA_499 [Olavius algarvensis associated proteobacterium Delta 3]CAB5084339.1 hypothetical protein D3OALGA1CA_438 [Olavius algarvensis associated proteobacterium Delta 3]